MSLLKNKYVLGGFVIYLLAILYLRYNFKESLEGFLSAFLILCLGFSFIAWWLLKDLPAITHRPAIKREWWLIILLIAWIAFYVSVGGSLLNKLIPSRFLDDERWGSFVIFFKKLLVFVLIPYGIYYSMGFRLTDFGLNNNYGKLSRSRAFAVFIVLAISGVLFQLYFSNKSKPFLEGKFSATQFLYGAPLAFIYLFFDAGLVEEFFFRGLLQSRLSVLLKSTTGAIITTSLIFALVHAPGLYLRGPESEGVSESLPFLFFVSYTIGYMAVAGVFLGVVWSRTKNLWLVMAIHAMVDMVPNFQSFIDTWKIS